MCVVITMSQKEKKLDVLPDLKCWNCNTTYEREHICDDLEKKCDTCGVRLVVCDGCQEYFSRDKAQEEDEFTFCSKHCLDVYRKEKEIE